MILNYYIDPPIPINVSLTYGAVHQILSWLPPTDDASNCIIHYTVYDSTHYITDTSSLNTTLSLSKGTVYNFTVTSNDTAGRVSEHSDVLTVVWKG